MTYFFGTFLDDVLGGCFRLSAGNKEVTTLGSFPGSSTGESPLGLETADKDVGKCDGVDRVDDTSERFGSVKRPSKT